jgi:hypothetical protein
MYLTNEIMISIIAGFLIFMMRNWLTSSILSELNLSTTNYSTYHSTSPTIGVSAIRSRHSRRRSR